MEARREIGGLLHRDKEDAGARQLACPVNSCEL